MRENAIIKKMLGLILLVAATFLFAACDKKVDPNPIEPEKQYVTVTFNTNGGGNIQAQTIEKGKKAIEPTPPNKEGYTFEYWYVSNESVSFQFDTVINDNITLNAKWRETTIGLTALERIEEDYLRIKDSFIVNRYRISTPTKGPVYNSTVRWNIDHKYVSTTGFVIPVLRDDNHTTAIISADFTLDGQSVNKTFNVPLSKPQDVIIYESRMLEFENLTTEYTLEDGELELFFEEGGAVPYVSVISFLNLLKGFIDPEIEFETIIDSDSIEISYDYYDEEEDRVYDLRNIINATDNTISTNDTGFFWAYIFSTETNFGRHITYDRNHPDASYVEGTEVTYDLSNYGMDIVMHNGEILVPYYIVNQLYAGSSYYNVYYNYDKLYGIYSLPEEDSPEYNAIRTSSKNGKSIPSDLLMHTFNTLAFNLDYFYGLKEIMDVDTYYDLLFDNKNKLLKITSRDVDEAIAEILLKRLDEPHTSYGYPSYFNSKSYSGPQVGTLGAYGTRFRNWYTAAYQKMDEAIENKFGRENIESNAWSASSTSRLPYWFASESVAVLILDSFSTSDIIESDVYDENAINRALEIEQSTSLLPAIEGGSRYFFHNNSTNDEKYVDVIIKGLSRVDLESYKDSLISSGFTYVYEQSSIDYKALGYYLKSFQDKDYMVQLTFDEKYDVFYLGIMDQTPEKYSDAWPFYIDVLETFKSDSAIYMEIMMESILKEKPSIQNIILDLSWNSGGNVGALYRVVGFITDQPFETTSIDRGTGSKSTSYIQIEGLPSYSNLNWGLLISPKTFSAANSMATIFMENNLGPIMGITSGGGACSITPILLPNGTAFIMSSNNISAYRTGTGTEADPFIYHDNEFGIAPDYVLTYEIIYDSATLVNIMVQ